MIRSPLITTMCFVVPIISASACYRPIPKLIWNATPSTPIGLYLLQPVHGLDVGDLVAVLPPESIARFLVDAGYLPKGVPLLKHVLALPRQLICRVGFTITIDGITMGEARERDSQGRDLPIWQGCRTLADSEIFLMNRQVGGSLDGRYFGPLPTSAIIGRAAPLWTDENSNGHFMWRASAP